MRINNNIMALNAHRQLGVNQTSASKNMEKLSSGLRINRAGDDAAGLAISEKMRGQIRGLKQAMRNAQDGISLIQTAEGALNETHSILQRMRELANQASTDTNTLTDRKEIQKEINQLLKEIDRISTDTEFNTQKLLGGNFTGKVFHIGANANQKMDVDIASMATADIGTLGRTGETGSGTPAAASGTLDVDGATAEFTGGEDAAYNVTITITANSSVSAGSESATWSGNTLTIALNDEATYNSSAIEGLVQGATTGAPTGVDATKFDVAGVSTATAGSKWAGSVTLTGGSAGGSDGSTSTNIDALSVTDAAIDGLDADLTDAEVETELAGNVGVLTQAGANAAITNVNDAIEQVSAERSKLGAMQNRLEHTIANLGTSAENLQAAESRIRDLDMAEEIMAFTKNNILQQAATAMLAQANMAPQSVLQLLG